MVDSYSEFAANALIFHLQHTQICTLEACHLAYIAVSTVNALQTLKVFHAKSNCFIILENLKGDKNEKKGIGLCAKGHKEHNKLGS